MEWFQEAIDVLENDGIILCPTDTIWGLSGNAVNTKAATKIHQLKQRPETKSFIVLVADVKMLSQYVESVPEYILNYLAETEKPTTVIYTNGKFPDEILATDQSVGIRIARDQWLKDFIHAYGFPIISTSANLSGDPTPTTFTDIPEKLKKKVDFIVPFKREELSTQASSIVKFVNGQLVVIRE